MAITGKILVILLFAALSITVGCTPDDERRTLAHADAIMEENPDSALIILDSIDTGTLRSEHDKALYALLLTQAQVKQYIPIASDSLVSTAVTYFDKHPEGDMLRRALHYKGMLLYLNNEPAKAIIPATRARDLALQDSDWLYIARAEELLADLFYLDYNFVESATRRTKAIAAYERAARPRNVLFAKCDLAKAIGTLGDNRRGYVILDSVRNVARSGTIDSALNGYADYAMLHFLMDSNAPGAALMIWEEMRDMNFPYDSPMRNLLTGATIKKRLGDFNGAKAALDSAYSLPNATRQDSIETMWGYMDIYDMQQDYRMAKLCADSLIRIMNREFTQALSASTTAAQRDFYSQSLEIERLESEIRTQRYHWIILSLAILAISAAVTAVALWKLRKARSEAFQNRIYALEEENISLCNKNLSLSRTNSTLTETNYSLSETNTHLSETNVTLQSDLESVYRKRMDTITEAWNCVADDGKEESVRTAAAASLRKEVRFLKSSKGMMELEEEVNRYMDNLATTLREECPFLQETDIRFVLMIYAAIPQKVICLIFEIKLSSFYSRRRRTIAKIKEADPPSAERLIRYIR